MFLCPTSSSGSFNGYLFQFVSAMIVDVWVFLFQIFLAQFKPLAAPRYIYCLGTQLTYTYEYVYIH